MPYKAQNINEELISNKLKIENSLSEQRYILGPGDRISIKFLELEQFSGEYTINSDGTLSLPIVGIVSANYLTLEKLTKKLQNLYGIELIKPDLFISLILRRPISVSVLGEINRPGLYKLYSIEKDNAPNQAVPNTFVNLPKIVDAISRAGGITPDSDIQSISVKRRLSGKEVSYANINVNLIDLLLKSKKKKFFLKKLSKSPGLI